MHWTRNYQLLLFDFDGILVDTEQLHYHAYKNMCASRGFVLEWDFPTYIRHAMYSADGLRKGIYREFPPLYRYEPCWDVLYREKKQAYAKLLHGQGVKLMPGVEGVLLELSRSKIKCCVVTHSTFEQVRWIRTQHPVLDIIPHWITREDYTHPKPSSQCYRKAIELFANKEDRIIGFEDSARGLKALIATQAYGVLVNNFLLPEEVKSIARIVGKEFVHIHSLDDAPNSKGIVYFDQKQGVCRSGSTY